MRRIFFFATLASFASAGVAMAQLPGPIYTWNGTGNTQGWIAQGGNSTILTNTTDGILTATEMGDSIDPLIVGGTWTLRKGDNLRREDSSDTGGLDLTGLTWLEFDVAHNSAQPVQAQFYSQVTPSYTYVTGNPDGTLGRGPWQDYTLAPGPQTLRLPINLLPSNEQAYFIGIGMTVRDHAALGNLTWTISELRSVGTPPSERILATHETGTSDSGFNGAFVNYGGAAIVGNGDTQSQTGLTITNSTGVGSMQWTDLGGTGEPGSPTGGAIGWGNGTFFGGNTFNERPADFTGYDQVVYRISATDAVNPAGSVAIQGYFQVNGYTQHFVAATMNLPTDGQYHDLIFPLGAAPLLRNVDAFGLDVNAHPNSIVFNVDKITFNDVQGVTGDYNNNGVVDAADYVRWRDSVGTTTVLPNDPVGGTIGTTQYDNWKANFGKTPGSGSAIGSAAVPEPTSTMLLLAVGLVGLLVYRRGV